MTVTVPTLPDGVSVRVPPNVRFDEPFGASASAVPTAVGKFNEFCEKLPVTVSIVCVYSNVAVTPTFE